MKQLQKSAMDYFQDPDMATTWMNTRFSGLGGRTPKQCAETPEGEQQVLKYFAEFLQLKRR